MKTLEDYNKAINAAYKELFHKIMSNITAELQ